MIIKIGNTEHRLHFGLKFIQELDKRHPEYINGVAFGYGVMHVAVALSQYNSLALLDVLQAGTITNDQLLTEEEVEQYIEEQQKAGKLFNLFTDFLEELEQASATAPTLQNIRLLMGENPKPKAPPKPRAKKPTTSTSSTD